MNTLFTKEIPTTVHDGTTRIVLKNFRGVVTMAAREQENIELITSFENALLTHSPQSIINALESLANG